MKKVLTWIAVFALSLTTISVSAAKTVTELNKEKSQIQNEKSTAKKALAETQNEKSRIQQEIESLDIELTAVTSEIERLDRELEKTQRLLTQTEEELQIATDDREEQYDVLMDRLRAMYESGPIGYLQIVFEADGFSDFINRVEYINRIIDYDQDVLGQFEATEKLIAEKVTQIEEQKLDIQVISGQQQSKKQTLDESLTAKSQLVIKLSNEEAVYSEQVAQLEKDEKEVQALIKEEQRKAAAAAAASRTYSYTGGRLQYPVPAYSGAPVNSPYGTRKSPINGRTEFHTGVDLKATMGTDIVAAEGGYVIFAGTKSGYGYTVIIDHGGGLSTLYAHNSKLLVTVGQKVNRAQVISKAGSTGYSTGPHLHFEVRENGEHKNPMNYLTN